MKKRVVAVVAVIVLLVGASVASIIYMKSGKNDGSKTAYIYRDNELLRTVSLDDVKNPYTFRIEYGDGEYNDILVENGKISTSQIGNQLIVFLDRLGIVYITCHVKTILTHFKESELIGGSIFVQEVIIFVSNTGRSIQSCKGLELRTVIQDILNGNIILIQV